jgi:hypothetical protein
MSRQDNSWDNKAPITYSHVALHRTALVDLHMHTVGTYLPTSLGTYTTPAPTGTCGRGRGLHDSGLNLTDNGLHALLRTCAPTYFRADYVCPIPKGEFSHSVIGGGAQVPCRVVGLRRPTWLKVEQSPNVAATTATKVEMEMRKMGPQAVWVG